MADNCNSLHTNAYDEAITTPTGESVRRAVAIQLINATEFGLLKTENPLQGSHIVEWLTDTVEEAVLEEFERMSERGDVLGAMEAMYQRGKIQEESLHYERMKHTGEHPLVGVNTFLAEESSAKRPKSRRSLAPHPRRRMPGSNTSRTSTSGNLRTRRTPCTNCRPSPATVETSSRSC